MGEEVKEKEKEDKVPPSFFFVRRAWNKEKVQRGGSPPHIHGMFPSLCN